LFGLGEPIDEADATACDWFLQFARIENEVAAQQIANARDRGGGNG